MKVLKYEHLIDGSIYDTKEECFEVADEKIDNIDIWNALTEIFPSSDILKALVNGGWEMYSQACNRAREQYIDDYFMKVEVEEDDD